MPPRNSQIHPTFVTIPVLVQKWKNKIKILF